MRLILIFLIVFSFNLSSQILDKEWTALFNTENSKIYISESTIKVFGNKVAAFILVVYNESRMDETIQLEVGREKVFYFFYLPKQKYSTVGKIFYDKNGLKIGETGSQYPVTSTDNFQENVDDDIVVSEILNNILRFLDDKGIKYSTDESDTKKDNQPPIKKLEEEFSKTDNKEEPKPVDLNSKEYNISNEKNIKGSIFSDGVRYVVQVSSWQQESKAIAEVNRLKSRGHDAFYVTVNIPGRGTWYRVRVGYFNNLRDAERYRF